MSREEPFRGGAEGGTRGRVRSPRKCERRAFVGPAFALICVVNRFTQPDQARRPVTP